MEEMRDADLCIMQVRRRNPFLVLSGVEFHGNKRHLDSLTFKKYGKM
jgi:hypothetical protein